MSSFSTVTLRDEATVRFKTAGDGPPLLLLGNMVSWEFWCHQIPCFAQHYRVIAPEYRKQPIPGCSALDALADDVPDLLHALGYDRALLMGHSIGAMVLAHMLARTPEVAHAVVLANGFLTLRVVPPLLLRWQPRLIPLISAIYPQLPWLLRQIGSYGMLWWDQHIFLHGEPDSEKRRMFYAYTHTPDSSMVLRLASALEYIGPPDLSRATMPVLVTSGGEDRWMYRWEPRRLTELLPCGEHVEFPGVGHMSPMIVPAAFNRTVLDFLGRSQRGVL